MQISLPSWDTMGRFAPLTASLAFVAGVLYLIDSSLRQRCYAQPDVQFRFSASCWR